MAETLLAGNVDGIIRINLIEAFINLTKFFTIGAFDEIVSEQEGVIFNYDDNLIKKITDTLSIKEKIINFD